jgi:acyl CoA:acetate/3-ketoacid CoA transferase
MEADLIFEALEQRFLTERHPSNVTVFAPMPPGDRLNRGGMNCFAHEGLLGKFIGSYFNKYRHPKLIELIRAGVCEGYNVGMGTMIQMLSAISSHKPGVLTTVGLETFLDPRLEGGCMNEKSRHPPVRVERLDEKEYLFYPSFPVDVAIVRATTADENGYLTFEEETNTLGMLELAAAAKASGGIVLAQVKRLAKANSLDPKLVRVPGPLVDVIVVHPGQLQLSQMLDPTHGWNPAFSGSLKAPLRDLPLLEGALDRSILRRAALELRPNDVVNTGAGIAVELPRIALEEGILDEVVFTNEHGVFGGLMGSAIGGSFVPALNADAVMDSLFQFGFYEGGGLDVTFLGMGQVDAFGNVNVSKFSGEWYGPGGFASITERTRRIVFCGALTAGGLRVEVESGALRIVTEGRHRKWLPRVEQITFNAKRAYASGQRVLYVTERAVFQLDEHGPELIEVAPGVDVERDVLSAIGFPVRVSGALREMDSRVFQASLMGLASAFRDQ